MALTRNEWTGIWVGIVIAVVTMSSAPWWWQYMPWEHRLPEGVTGMSGGCDAYQVFAQNRWDPVGPVVRAAPSITSKIVSIQYGANQSIAVNGWVHSRAAYPTNKSPWNSDIWFHVADDSGWVSFAGVRETPVGHDPSGLSPDGGPPAPTPGNCQGAVQ